jgi:hypothetical protein
MFNYDQAKVFTGLEKALYFIPIFILSGFVIINMLIYIIVEALAYMAVKNAVNNQTKYLDI